MSSQTNPLNHRLSWHPITPRTVHRSKFRADTGRNPFFAVLVLLIMHSNANGQEPFPVDELSISEVTTQTFRLGFTHEIVFSADGNQLAFLGSNNSSTVDGYFYNRTTSTWREFKRYASTPSVLRAPKPKSRDERPPLNWAPTKEFAGFITVPPRSQLLGINRKKLIYCQEDDSGMQLAAFDFDGKKIGRPMLSKPRGVDINANERIGIQVSVGIVPQRSDVLAQQLGVFNVASGNFTAIKDVKEANLRRRRSRDDTGAVPGRTTALLTTAFAEGVQIHRPRVSEVTATFPPSLKAVFDWGLVNDDRWLMVVGSSEKERSLCLWLFDTTSGALIQEKSLESPDEYGLSVKIEQNPQRSGNRYSCIRATTSANLFAIATQNGPYFFEVKENGVNEIATPQTTPALEYLTSAECWDISPQGDQIAAVIQKRDSRNMKQYLAVLVKTEDLIGKVVSDHQNTTASSATDLTNAAEIDMPAAKPPQGNDSTYAKLMIRLPYNSYASTSDDLKMISPTGNYVLLPDKYVAVDPRTNQYVFNKSGGNLQRLGRLLPIYDLRSGELAATIDHTRPAEIGPFAAKLPPAVLQAFAVHHVPVSIAVPFEQTVHSVSFDGDGNVRIVIEPARGKGPGNGGKVPCRIVSVGDGRELRTLQLTIHPFAGTTLTPDRRIYSDGARAHIYDFPQGKRSSLTDLTKPQGVTGNFHKGGVTVSPDGTWLAAVYDKGLLTFKTGDSTYQGAIQFPVSPRVASPDRKVQFVSDELVFVFDSDHGFMSLIDVRAGKEIERRPTNLKAFFQSLEPMQVAGNGEFVCLLRETDRIKDFLCVRIDQQQKKIAGVWQAELPSTDNFEKLQAVEFLAAANGEMAAVGGQSINDMRGDKHIIAIDLEKLTATVSCKVE